MQKRFVNFSSAQNKEKTPRRLDENRKHTQIHARSEASNAPPCPVTSFDFSTFVVVMSGKTL